MTFTPGPSREAPSEADYLRLDQQICFSLNAASRAFGGIYRVLLKDRVVLAGHSMGAFVAALA
ncbi:hypothetical protein ACWCQX_49935, partial [Streptomyces sp. NPDC002346]